MNKVETVKRFKNAQQVEQEAKEQAQHLADQTAAELEELARSMHRITGTLSELMMRIAKESKHSSESARQSAQKLDKTSEAMTQTANLWELTAGRLQLQLRAQTRKWFVIAALCGGAGGVSAGLLNHYLHGSNQAISPPQPVTIDTDRLALQIITYWKAYQTQGAQR